MFSGFTNPTTGRPDAPGGMPPGSTGGIPVKLPEDSAARQARARRRTLVLAALYSASFLPVAGWLDRWPIICFWRRLTGHYCPFCGLTHSLVALSHGSIRLALACHPFGPVVYAAGLFLLADSIHAWATGAGVSRLAGHRKALRWLAGLTVSVWLLWWLASRLASK